MEELRLENSIVEKARIGIRKLILEHCCGPTVKHLEDQRHFSFAPSLPPSLPFMRTGESI